MAFADRHFIGLIAEPVSLLMQRVEQDAVQKVHIFNFFLQFVLLTGINKILLIFLKGKNKMNILCIIV